MLKRIPGTKDILPYEVGQWQEIEKIARSIFSLYNYKEIRPPLIEEAVLFNRSLGESTEIVQKQMFLIKHGKDLYALRPEGTASVVRAYLENNLDKNAGFAKFYYIGPMFRAERPQMGRLRQFHHIGCEVIGSHDPALDVEIISLADILLKKFRDVFDYKIKLNSLGCAKDKKALADYLRKALKDKLSRLCDDCKKRFKVNVFRILDCKDEACSAIVKDLGISQGHLCDDCQEHFTRVKEGLDALGVEYEVTPYLVRGLDYYTRTVFEVSHSDLGAQNALCAGGRYDNLVRELGGPSVGAMGFAFGVDRIMMLKGLNIDLAESKLGAYIIPLGEEAKKESIKLLNDLRKEGITADTDYENKSLKGVMRKANDLKARFVLIIGDDELKKNVITLKDMNSGEQREVKPKDLIKELKC
jgi:histidyl-tRNA synthetase